LFIWAFDFIYAEKKGWSKKIIVQNRITNLGNQSEIGISIHNLEKGDSLTFDFGLRPFSTLAKHHYQQLLEQGNLKWLNS